ncbi:MAG TPA: ferritin-like domain-containing protein [Terriglobales bacterium]|nr:ferritin-like domain-containing protein [Terriglobales bacterium]
MKSEKSPAVLPTEQEILDLNLAEKWERVVRRRSFLKGLGVATATVSAGALLLSHTDAFAQTTTGTLSKGDADILRFLATAELIESDLWQQYNELGGAHGGNPAYILALQNLDGDMPQYIEDNTDDEISHAAFLNAYLISRGEAPVDLDAFRTLPSSQATGAQDIGRLTNLMSLNVDTSWYTRYRSDKNPDLGATFTGPVTIRHEPAIPLNDTDTPPTQSQPVPPVTKQQRRMQAIANTAGFHFAFIEQGGSSLYPTMALKVTDLEVLRIVISIGGVEVDHFGLWHDKAGNAVSQPLAGVTDPETGVTFPDLNNPPTELTQTNKILPEPCDFIQKGTLPKCSVIRPVSTVGKSGAVAAIQGFINDRLFLGQSQAFLKTVMDLAAAADAATRGF